MEINSKNIKMWSKLGARGTFGVAMLELGKELDNLVVLTSDLGITSGLDRFKNNYPDKFINVGIAEQNMINIGAGLAKEGLNVFVTTFANFAAMRSYEQMRLSLGYMQMNVKVVGIGSGLSMGLFGNTHYGIEDLAILRATPGLTIISPADGAEIVKTVFEAAKYQKPVYIRLTGAMNNPIVYKENYSFEIGKGVLLKEGSDLTIIATGTMVYESLIAAEILQTKGIEARVINMHTIKPIDTEIINSAVRDTKLIVTVEEHSVIGGLGGAVAEYIGTLDNRARQVFIGLPDDFGRAGDYKYLLNKYGLTSEKIAKKIIESL